MMHTIKRAVSGAKAAKQEPTCTEHEEYDLLKGKLTDIANALSRGVKDTETSQLKWVHVLNDTEDFFRRMSDRYPEEDFTLVKMQRASQTMQSSVRDGKHDLIHPDSHGERLLNNVRHYIAHIRGMEESYSRVDVAYKDYAMYHQKLDKLVTKVDDTEKQVRNEEKYESSKSAYYGLLHSTVERQKVADDRAPSMFRAVYVAYCLCSKGMCKILTNELDEHFSYAESHHDDLVSKTAAIDLNAGSPKAGEDHFSSTSSSYSTPHSTHSHDPSHTHGLGVGSTPHSTHSHEPSHTHGLGLGSSPHSTHEPHTHGLGLGSTPHSTHEPSHDHGLGVGSTPSYTTHGTKDYGDSNPIYSTPDTLASAPSDTGAHIGSTPVYTTPSTEHMSGSTPSVGPGGGTFPMGTHPIGTDPTIVSSATTGTPPGATRPVGTHAPGTHHV